MHKRRYAALHGMQLHGAWPPLIFRSSETADQLVNVEQPTMMLSLVCRFTVWLDVSSRKKTRTIAADFGAVIRELRKHRGLSQERLAEAAGLHRTYIGFIERGERTVTIETAQKLAAALDSSLADVFAKVEHRARPHAHALQEASHTGGTFSLLVQVTCIQRGVTHGAHGTRLVYTVVLRLIDRTAVSLTPARLGEPRLCGGDAEDAIVLSSR